MTPELLTDAGKMLFGDEWVPSMAESLEVTPRTVRRWAAGTQEIPPGVAGEVADLLSQLLLDWENDRPGVEALARRLRAL